MTPIKPVIRLLLLFLVLFAPLPRLSAGSILFSYTIPAGATTTSAGVFAADGTLLRTLWSNELATPGPNSGIWDGLDDEGQALAPGSYTVKVLHSQVTHDWQGTIANTSVDQTGVNVRRTFEPFLDLTISGSDMFFSNAYNEKKSNFSRSLKATPNVVSYQSAHKESSRSYNHAATDGTCVYYAQVSTYLRPQSFVVAYKISDNTLRAFTDSSCTIVNPGQGAINYGRVCDFTDPSPASQNVQMAATGIAVQTSGAALFANLFVAHGPLDVIRVFDKVTGAAKTTKAATAPGRMVVTRDDTGLWAIVTESGNRVVRRYSIDGSGNLTNSAVITGFSNPLALAVSPDNSILLVADGGSNQQVRAFTNVTSGTLTQSNALWTLGQLGGVAANGTAVANDKFNFRIYDKVPDNVKAHSYLAFQDDGGGASSFWVGDPGNERSLRFSTSTRAYQDQILYLSHSYVMTVAAGDPTRVFAGWKEFSTNYSTPINQSWAYVRDWAAGLPESVSDVDYAGFNSVVILGGRTFGVADKKVYELQSTGVLRDTGIVFTNELLHEDGSLRWGDVTTDTTKTTYYKRAFSSLNGSNNPVWATAASLGSNPNTLTNPRTNSGGRGGSGMRHPSTSSGLLVFSDGSDKRFHLGGLTEGTTDLKWRSAPSGLYFDTHGTIGNQGHYPANNAYTNGDHIVFAAHGEGASDIYSRTYQANQFLHFWKNGLQVGQFGSPLNYPTSMGDLTDGFYAGRAGNALSSAFVTHGGNLYYWHCDESQSSGLHLWKITNAGTVAEISVGVTLPSGNNGTGLTGQYFNGTDPETYTLVTEGTDAAVDFNWTSGSPASGVTTDNFSVRWSGLVQPLYSETYTFTLTKPSANNARLYINDTLIADGWTTTGASITGNVALTAGQKYTLLLEYRDGTAGQNTAVTLKWSSTSQALQTIPYAQLFPSDAFAINFGGPAVGRFQADPFQLGTAATSGSSNHIYTNNAITVAPSIFDPAPQAVLKRARQGSLSRLGVITLAPYTQYRVRLHLAEIATDKQSVGARIFDFVAPSLATVRDNIDIFSLAGGGYKAHVIEEIMSTDNAGHLSIGTASSPTTSLVNAIEITRSPSTLPAYTATGAGGGLKGEYYTGTNQDMSLNTLVATRVDPYVDFAWTTTNPPPGIPSNTNYTVCWTGKVLTKLAGTYSFRVDHDKGAVLKVNGTTVVNQWGTNGNHTGTIALAAFTLYDIELKYLQTTGTSKAILKWIPADGSSTAVVVPRSQLYNDYAPPPPSGPVEVVVDNSDGPGTVTITGAWTNSTSNPGYLGTNYVHDGNASKGSKSVRFTPNLPSAGTYDVYMRWPAWASAANNAPVAITHPGGTANTTVNLRANSGVWMLIGSQTFNAGTGGYVTISNTGTTQHVFADAVKFVKP